MFGLRRVYWRRQNPATRKSNHPQCTLAILRWTLILAGWVMGGILAAAVSARFRN